MFLKLSICEFRTVEEMLETGIKYATGENTHSHPFIVDCGPIFIENLYGVIRYYKNDNKIKEITASKAISIIIKKGAKSWKA